MTADRDIPDLRAAGEAYAFAVRGEQPPLELDRKIRAAAAAHAAQRRARRVAARAWLAGTAAAATLIVALAVLRAERELDTAATATTARNAADMRTATPDPNAAASGKITFDPQQQPSAAAECSAVAAAPDGWLDCIATLARAGETAAVARELDAFRARFPDYELPAELTSPASR